LNRTNRTLTANLNRLNLGTRSLAARAGVNTVANTLRLQHTHPVKRSKSKRIGIMRGMDPAMFMAYPFPLIPSSPPASSWPAVAAEERARAEVAVAVPTVRPVVVDDRACRAAQAQDSLPQGWQTGWQSTGQVPADRFGATAADRPTLSAAARLSAAAG